MDDLGYGVYQVTNEECERCVLDASDLKTIQALDEGESLFFSHYDPATVEMLTGLVC